jgi:sucrose-6-phosphate hydrolase SacC (GH32 family)
VAQGRRWLSIAAGLLADETVSTTDFDGSTFTPTTSGQLDAGPNFYAAQAFVDAAGRPLVVGWKNNGGAFDPNRLDGWSRSETVNRVLSVKADGTLGTAPIPELATLHTGAAGRVRPQILSAGKQMPIAAGDSLDIRTGFDVSRSTATALGLRPMSSSAEGIALTYTPASHQLTLDTTKSGYGAGSVSTASVLPGPNGQLDLRVLTDRASIEVFTDNGVALSARM